MIDEWTTEAGEFFVLLLSVIESGNQNEGT